MSLPAQHIEEAWQSAEFYANKILMEYRSKEPKHVIWVKQLKELLMRMRAHVQAHHRTGADWNPQGIAFSEFNPKARTQGTFCISGGACVTALLLHAAQSILGAWLQPLAV